MNASTVKEYTHSSLQLHSNGERIKDEEQSVTVSYQSIESFKDHLVSEIMKQPNIFMGMSLLSDAQRLNNGKRLLNDRDMVEIKKHFREKELLPLESENVEKEIVKKEKSQIELSVSQKAFSRKRNKGNRNIHREMSKGYMQMLSEIECSR